MAGCDWCQCHVSSLRNVHAGAGVHPDLWRVNVGRNAGHSLSNGNCFVVAREFGQLSHAREFYSQ